MARILGTVEARGKNFVFSRASGRDAVSKRFSAALRTCRSVAPMGAPRGGERRHGARQHLSRLWAVSFTAVRGVPASAINCHQPIDLNRF